MNIEIPVKTGKPVFQDDYIVYHTVQKEVNEHLKPYCSHWDLKNSLLIVPERTINGCRMEELFYSLFENAMSQVTEWKKRINGRAQFIVIIFYIAAIIFASAAYEQTHGWVAGIILISAIIFLFIPWWFSTLSWHIAEFIYKNWPYDDN